MLISKTNVKEYILYKVVLKWLVSHFYLKTRKNEVCVSTPIHGNNSTFNTWM